MFPKTPLPNPAYPKADARLFEIPYGVPWNGFLSKAMEIVARITDENKAREWLHNNGISGIMIQTPFFKIDTRVKNFWTDLADTLTPVVVQLGSMVPIVGQVFKKAADASMNPLITKLSNEDYQGEAIYQNVMNGTTAGIQTSQSVSGSAPSTSDLVSIPLVALGLLFFFFILRGKRKSKKGN